MFSTYGYKSAKTPAIETGGYGTRPFFDKLGCAFLRLVSIAKQLISGFKLLLVCLPAQTSSAYVMQSSKPFFHTTPAREDVVCTISVATFARNRQNLPTNPSDNEDIIVREVRLVEESVISSGD